MTEKNTYVYLDENGFFFKEFKTVEAKQKWEQGETFVNCIGDKEDFCRQALDTVKALCIDKSYGDYDALLR